MRDTARQQFINSRRKTTNTKHIIYSTRTNFAVLLLALITSKKHTQHTFHQNPEGFSTRCLPLALPAVLPRSPQRVIPCQSQLPGMMLGGFQNGLSNKKLPLDGFYVCFTWFLPTFSDEPICTMHTRQEVSKSNSMPTRKVMVSLYLVVISLSHRFHFNNFTSPYHFVDLCLLSLPLHLQGHAIKKATKSFVVHLKLHFRILDPYIPFIFPEIIRP